MKNFIITLLLIAILSFIAQHFIEWWSIAAVAFIVSFLFKQKAWAAFIAGFLAIFILWAVYAAMLSSANNNILANKVADLFQISGNSKVIILYTITGVIGGLVGGFSALTGRLAAALR